MNHRFDALLRGLSRALIGKPQVVELTAVAALGGGHLLLEDLPGVGKTTLGRAAARLLGGEFQRVQLTADLMPSDLTGVSVFHPKEGRFTFQAGPVFCNVLLADEVNRASPKTQSSLLEAMAEGQVTVDRQTHALPSPFWVIATQNPSTFEGTFPLPESQLDRFGLSCEIGYPPYEAERAALKVGGGDRVLSELAPAFTLDEWATERARALEVRVEDALIDYLLAVVRQTREHPEIQVGVSPRGALGWQRACQARAHLKGRGFVTPDDAKTLAVPALAHRVWTRRKGSSAGQRRALIEEIVARVPVPR
jgi:MoxR-like ATPase